MHALRTLRRPGAAAPPTAARTGAAPRAGQPTHSRHRTAVAASDSADAVADAAKAAIVDKIGQDAASAAAESLGAPPEPRLPGARPFSTALAVGLASAAFDSYYQAVGADESAAWTEASGTRVQYINAGALAAAARGVLTVTLSSADGLTASDAWGTSDPYAVVKVGACGHRSATVATAAAAAGAVERERVKGVLFFLLCNQATRNTDQHSTPVKINTHKLVHARHASLYRPRIAHVF